MSAVEQRPDRNGKRATARTALPPTPFAIWAGVSANIIAFAVRANGLTLPPDLFEVVDCLLLSLK